MEPIKVITVTDWYMVIATVLSGVFAALATLYAVMISNKETRKQLIKQQDAHMKERMDYERNKKMVIVKPTIVLSSFTGILDSLIIQNSYNRELLFSGDDGFDFFDDFNKRQAQRCRILHIENCSNNIIKDVCFITKSCLENRDTNEKIYYDTKNALNILRAKECIDIRMANQEQYERVVYMNNNKIPSEFEFESIIEYSTEAGQRVKYCYSVNISNDRVTEIKRDGIEKIVDDANVDVKTTVFRNLQDYICIDRSEYIWKKMGRSQWEGVIEMVNNPLVQQSNSISTQENNNKQNK